MRTALEQANGSVKLAFLLLQGCAPNEAEAVLDRAGGQLRVALALMAKPFAGTPELDSPDIGGAQESEDADAEPRKVLPRL